MKIKYFPFYGLSILPMPMLYALSDFIFYIAYYLLKYRRNVVSDNLRRSFPDKNDQEIQHIEKNFYRHLCDIIFETIKGLTISAKEIEKRIHFKNLDLIDRYFKDRKNIVMYAAHQGNWEWLSFLQLYVSYQGLTVYQPLSNKYFNELMKIIRERFGAICVETNKSYRTILEFIQNDQLTLTAVIGDQSPAKDSAKCWLNFLNQETAFLRGAERIVERTNQIALFPAFTRKQRGVYELEFKHLNGQQVVKKNSRIIIDKRTNQIALFPAFNEKHRGTLESEFKHLTGQKGAKNSSLIIEEFAKVLEETIKKSPEMWLWSHRRWKLTKTA